MGVAHQLLGLGLLFRTHIVSAELVDRLRRKSEVPHHRNTGREDAVDRFENLLAALDLHGVGFGLLHDADGRIERHLRIALIGAERQIDDHQRAIDGAHDRAGVIDHHIEGDGKRRFITGHHIGRRIADKNHVDTRGIDDLRHRIVVRGQHGDLFAALFHLRQPVGRNGPDSTFYRHSSLRTRWSI